MDSLYELSADEGVRSEYEMRMKARRDRMPQNEGYYRDGLREGKQEGKLEVTRKALAEGVAPEMVSKLTGLDMETIRGP